MLDRFDSLSAKYANRRLNNTDFKELFLTVLETLVKLYKINELLMMTNCNIIELPRFLDKRGNLSFVQNNSQIPFEIKRTYWIYDVPGGEHRGGHAYKDTEEFVIAISGSFDVIVDDGKNKLKFNLNRSYIGLYIPKGLWREMENFSTNALALEFASTQYNPDDYIRDYEEFLKLKEDGKI